jgi:radical SAM protein with 4Fe4S-binding SPASM domain
VPTTTVPSPQRLQVEVTSACNLACRMCLVRYRPRVNRREGAMDLAVFRRLLDANPEVREVVLQGLGEPLLSPHLFDMVRLAKERGAEVEFNTNATLLTRARADRLVELGLDRLHISLDGASEATYSYVRDGARWSMVERGLRAIAEAKAAAGAALPAVRVVFVAMRCNVHELPDLVRLAHAHRVTQVRVQSLSHTFDDTDPAGAYAGIRAFARAQALPLAPPAERERADDAFRSAARIAAALGVDLRLPQLDATAGRCTWPWTGAYVTSAGTVQPCCMVMGDDRVSLGSLADADFAEIWHGPAYERFRAALASDEPPEVCRGCSMYTGTF